MRVGVFPGSFNPVTVAHLAIADAAVEQCRLDRLDLVVSRVALAKEHVTRPRLEDRLAVLEAVVAHRPALGIRLTDHRLLVDIARGYDVLVVGADKWQQLHDPAWYGGSVAERDAALADLCTVVVAPRPPFDGPEGRTLAIAGDHGTVSSTHARSGRRDWMAPEAAAFDRLTGAWTDPSRYDRWVAAQASGSA